MGKKRSRLNDIEHENTTETVTVQSDPFKELLVKSFGYPTESSNVTRLKPIPPSSELETVIGAVYWIRAFSEEWIQAQPWNEHLLCKPHKNSLAPGAPKSFSVSYRNESKPNWIGLPRFLGLSLFGRPKRDIRSFGFDMTPHVSLAEDRPLRDYQMKARDAALSSLEEWGGATIIADCGAGKTALALSIAASLKRKTLILCNRTFLMQQWRSEIVGKRWTWSDDNSETDSSSECKIKCENCKKKCIGVPTQLCECGFRHVTAWIGKTPPFNGWLLNARVGWLQGAELIDTCDKDFVVASIDSLSQCKYSADMLKEFGLVIIDEMHHLGALTLSQVLPKIPSRYILGITATPDRNDGLEHVLYWLAGPTCFVYKRLPSITGLTRTVEVIQHLFTIGNRTEIIYKGGKIGFAAMVNALSVDEKRNDYIVQLARSALDKKRKKLLIVTSIVDHAKFLGSILKALVIHGGCSPALVAQAKSADTTVVIATYQFLEEGYDDPFLDTLLMALPRSKIQQVVGRCERTHEGKLVPEIIDIVDTFSVFEAMSWKRHHFYKSRGFGITRR
jgi:superfamily II DNA or RNA helicase